MSDFRSPNSITRYNNIEDGSVSRSLFSDQDDESVSRSLFSDQDDESVSRTLFSNQDDESVSRTLFSNQDDEEEFCPIVKLNLTIDSYIHYRHDNLNKIGIIKKLEYTEIEKEGEKIKKYTSIKIAYEKCYINLSANFIDIEYKETDFEIKYLSNIKEITEDQYFDIIIKSRLSTLCTYKNINNGMITNYVGTNKLIYNNNLEFFNNIDLYFEDDSYHDLNFYIDSTSKMTKLSTSNLHFNRLLQNFVFKNLKVRYSDSIGMDIGGLTRDFFQKYSDYLYNEKILIENKNKKYIFTDKSIDYREMVMYSLTFYLGFFNDVILPVDLDPLIYFYIEKFSKLYNFSSYKYSECMYSQFKPLDLSFDIHTIVNKFKDLSNQKPIYYKEFNSLLENFIKESENMFIYEDKIKNIKYFIKHLLPIEFEIYDLIKDYIPKDKDNFIMSNDIFINMISSINHGFLNYKIFRDDTLSLEEILKKFEPLNIDDKYKEDLGLIKLYVENPQYIDPPLQFIDNYEELLKNISEEIDHEMNVISHLENSTMSIKSRQDKLLRIIFESKFGLQNFNTKVFIEIFLRSSLIDNNLSNIKINPFFNRDSKFILHDINFNNIKKKIYNPIIDIEIFLKNLKIQKLNSGLDFIDVPENIRDKIISLIKYQYNKLDGDEYIKEILYFASGSRAYYPNKEYAFIFTNTKKWASHTCFFYIEFPICTLTKIENLVNEEKNNKNCEPEILSEDENEIFSYEKFKNVNIVDEFNMAGGAIEQFNESYNNLINKLSNF